MDLKIKSIFAFIFFNFALNIKAQMCPCEFNKGENKPLRYEFGLNALNFNENIVNFYSAKRKYAPQVLPGLKIKRHFNSYSIRLGFDYLEQKFDYQSLDPLNWNINNGNSFSKVLKLGIEKTLVNRRIQVFIAADIIGIKSNISGITEGYGDFAPYYKKPYDFKLSAIGISPVLGLKYRPIERFSISLETSLSVIYWKTKGNQSVYRNESNESLIINPLGLLSFNYHLLR